MSCRVRARRCLPPSDLRSPRWCWPASSGCPFRPPWPPPVAARTQGAPAAPRPCWQLRAARRRSRRTPPRRSTGPSTATSVVAWTSSPSPTTARCGWTGAAWPTTSRPPTRRAPTRRPLRPPPTTVPAGVDPLALESRPGSARTIYLDFTGETVTGTAWNDDEQHRVHHGRAVLPGHHRLHRLLLVRARRDLPGVARRLRGLRAFRRQRHDEGPRRLGDRPDRQLRPRLRHPGRGHQRRPALRRVQDAAARRTWTSSTRPEPATPSTSRPGSSPTG